MYSLICRRTPETGQRKGRRDRCGCQKSDVRKQQEDAFCLESDKFLAWYSVDMSASTDFNFKSKFIQMSKVSMSYPLFNAFKTKVYYKVLIKRYKCFSIRIIFRN